MIMGYNKETKMWDGFIYIIRNDINPEKNYIGQTCNNLAIRWRGHVNQSKPKNHIFTDKLHNAMFKYGIEHFAMDIIAKYSSTSKKDLMNILDEMEIYYIAKFNSYYNGYNSTKGGRGAKDHQTRRVCQFDLDGKFIAEYESIDSLKEVLNIDSIRTIYDCCNHNSRYGYGFIWKYQNDNSQLPILSDKEKTEARNRMSSMNQIVKYDYRGNLIAIYKNINDAASDNLHVTKRQIYKSCIGESVYAGIDIYRFVKDKFNTYATYRTKPKLVEQYDLNKNIVSVYTSTRDAARKTNINCTCISLACRHKLKTAGGFYWRYVGDLINFDNNNKHCKEIYQYDKNGELINKFDSIKQASEATNISASTITIQAKGKYNLVTHPYVWSYTPITIQEIIKRTTNKHNKIVYQYDLNGNYITMYDSGKLAAQQFKDHPNAAQSIYNCCRGIKKSAYGYIWKYERETKEGA